MLTTAIEPRFSDTDALGHISNTTYSMWFEDARAGLFELFHPSLDLKTWPLILARTEFDFLEQSYWGSKITVKTYIEKLGNSSCRVINEAWQNDRVVAKGLAIMIYFDYQTNKSVSIPNEIRERLSVHIPSST